jgi:hypothetical protein
VLLRRPPAILITAAVIVLVTTLGPSDRTLGANLRLVILHGAWVWCGIIAFTLSALAGLLWLLARLAMKKSPGNRPANWPDLAAAALAKLFQDEALWSLALSRTALVLWLTYLPMSLYVKQVNWGGLAFSEPRWRIPFTLGMVAVLLQLGLTLVDRPLASALGNLLFGGALLFNLAQAQNVLQPDSPISQSGSLRIQLFFLILLGLCLMLGGQIALWWRYKLRQPSHP